MANARSSNPRTGFGSSLEFEGFDVDPNLQSDDMEGDITRSKSRWSLPSQSKGINGVAGNCGDTGMEQNFWRVF